MIRYKDNPNLKLKVVTTIKGKTEYRRNCRKIRERYYIINEDVFEIDGRWYSATSKLITLDYETGKYVVTKKTALVYGIVGFKAVNVPIFGYFTENKYNNLMVHVSGYGSVKALNDSVLLEGKYIEDISTGVWHYSRDLSSNSIEKMKRIHGKKVYTNKGYNIEDNAAEFDQKIKAYTDFPHKIATNAARYGKLLGQTSWGMEVETSVGYLPEHLQNRTGIVICRDGSIDNAEYVTVPMRGAKGLVNVKMMSEYLTQRTLTDIRCSFHIHLGTLPTDRLFIVALYALGMRIQDELFTMFPYYKTDWKGVKKQNYNQKLRKLGIGIIKPDMNKEGFTKYVDESYYRIFTWLNDGIPPDDNFNRNTNRHTQTAKWNRKQRYFWLNFMNLFFSSRRTAEFRLHQPTLNGQKMVNWLFICNAIVRYAETHAKKILSDGSPIPLNTVLDYYADTFKTKEAIFLSDYLKAYVQDRKDYFYKDFNRGDFISDRELQDDKTYVFEYKGVSWLY